MNYLSFGLVMEEKTMKTKTKCECHKTKFCQKCGAYLPEVSSDSDPLVHRASMMSPLGTGLRLCDDCYCQEIEWLIEDEKNQEVDY